MRNIYNMLNYLFENLPAPAKHFCDGVTIDTAR